MNDNPIGVYDSGMGGLSVWRELRRALPGESLLYLGDGKNCPYGSRPAEEIRALADEAVGAMTGWGCKMVVVACNTATTAAISFLRAKYTDIPLIGLEPAIKPACLTTRSGVVGVLATERSLGGEMFRRTAGEYGEGIEIVTAAGRGFVELVEQNREDTPEAEECVREAMRKMIERGDDKVVLGCTHYPFLRGTIERVIGGRDIEVIDSSAAVARRAGELLDRYGLRASAGHTPEYTFRTFADDAYAEALRRKAFGENSKFKIQNSK